MPVLFQWTSVDPADPPTYACRETAFWAFRLLLFLLPEAELDWAW